MSLFHRNKPEREALVVSRSAKEYYMEAAALRLLERLRVFHSARRAPLIATTNDHLGQQILARGVYEGALLELFFEKVLRDRHSTFASSLAIDVGANVGNHTLFFARFFGKVLAIEANPIIADICAANMRLNRLDNVEVLPFGLSDSNSVEEFHELQEFNIASSQLGRHLAADCDCSSTIKISVPLRLGDDVVHEYSTEMNVALVKIDVEGHEPWVVRGLENTLKSGDAIVLFESKKKHGDDGGSVVMKQLEDFGYKYFYSADVDIPHVCRLPRPIGTIAGFLTRLVTGVRHRVYFIDELEDRFYGLIVASKAPIDLSSVTSATL